MEICEGTRVGDGGNWFWEPKRGAVACVLRR
jgi:hypothetical protein